MANHSRISLDAKVGNGMDRHMFAMRDIATRGGDDGDVPALFNDPAYAALSEVILSTSTLSSDALVGGGFGPVNAQCYALGYGIEQSGARFSGMSYGRDAGVLLEHIDGALRSIRELVEQK